MKDKLTTSGTCPLCGRWYPASFLALHASSCSTPSVGKGSISKRKPNPRRSLAPRRPSAVAVGRERSQANELSKLLRAPRVRTSLPADSPVTERGAPGFHVFEDIVTLDEEAAILKAVEETPPEWKDMKVRRSKGYGPPFSLQERRFLHHADGFPSLPLPAYAHELIMPLIRARIPRNIYDGTPNQMAVQAYNGTSETYIMPHSDCENDHMHDPILGLCLSASTTMTLILPKPLSPTGRPIKHDVRLPRRCLYVMSGDALYRWHHGIFPGRTEGVRYSITFRRAFPKTRAQWQTETPKRE